MAHSSGIEIMPILDKMSILIRPAWRVAGTIGLPMHGSRTTLKLGNASLDRPGTGVPVSTQVFEVNALVFVPLFLSQYVGSSRMISRPFPVSHCEACG